MFLLLYLLIMIFGTVMPGSPMEMLTVLKSLGESISSNPTEKDKLNAMIEALKNQTNELVNNSEIQKSNILFFSELLNRVLFEMMWYENHKKNFIDQKMQNIELQYNVLCKNILNTIELAKNSKITNLVKIFIAFVHNAYQEYFDRSRVYQAMLIGKTVNNKKKLSTVFSENPMEEIKSMKDRVTGFDNINNTLELAMATNQEKMTKYFADAMHTISQKINYLISIEKNKDISDSSTKFYNLSAIEDQLKDLMFASITEKKQMIDKSDKMLLYMEVCLHKIGKKLLVIQSAFIKEKERPSYQMQDLIAELLAKSIVQDETKEANKNKFFNNLQFQDNRFLTLLKKSKGFIERYRKDIASQNDRIKKDNFDSIMNSFSTLISLYQSYAVGLISKVNNLSPFFNTINYVSEWKENLFKAVEAYDQIKKSPGVRSDPSVNKILGAIKESSHGIHIGHPRRHKQIKHIKKR